MAYRYDPNGIRFEIATGRPPVELGVVSSVLRTDEEMRADLSTLFDDSKRVGEWIAKMPVSHEQPATA